MSDDIAQYLERSARILSDCAELLLQIEDGVAPLVARVPELPNTDGALQKAIASHVVSLQSIDLLSQTLEDMALWFEGLAWAARHKPPPPLDASVAFARLRLADVRHRLQGRSVISGKALSEPMLF